MKDYAKLTYDLIEAASPGAHDMPLTRKTAVFLRNMVCHKILHYQAGEGSEQTNVWASAEDRYNMLERAFNLDESVPELKLACGGTTLAFLIVLQSIGFEARYVGLYQDPDNLGPGIKTHASVDVRIDNKWYALDPYFNASFYGEDGEPLSWLDIWRRVQSGDTIHPSHDGCEPQGRMTLAHLNEEYPLDLVATCIILGASKGDIHRLVPPTWDGLLNYQDGRPSFDTVQGYVHFSGYAELASPSTRDASS